MRKPIEFKRQDQTVKAEHGGTRTAQVDWSVVHPEGCGLSIRVTEDGINVLGGQPAFDDQREENHWRFQIEMAIVALKLIQQKSLVSNDDMLAGLVVSMRQPE